jgi:hypothetical protein
LDWFGVDGRGHFARLVGRRGAGEVVLRGDSCDGGAGVDGRERDVVFDDGERIQGLHLITVFFLEIRLFYGILLGNLPNGVGPHTESCPNISESRSSSSTP